MVLSQIFRETKAQSSTYTAFTSFWKKFREINVFPNKPSYRKQFNFRASLNPTWGSSKSNLELHLRPAMSSNGRKP